MLSASVRYVVARNSREYKPGTGRISWVGVGPLGLWCYTPSSSFVPPAGIHFFSSRRPPPLFLSPFLMRRAPFSLSLSLETRDFCFAPETRICFRLQPHRIAAAARGPRGPRRQGLSRAALTRHSANWFSRLHNFIRGIIKRLVSTSWFWGQFGLGSHARARVRPFLPSPSRYRRRQCKTIPTSVGLRESACPNGPGGPTSPALSCFLLPLSSPPTIYSHENVPPLRGGFDLHKNTTVVYCGRN